MATRLITEYLNLTNGYRTGQRFVGTYFQTHATNLNPITVLLTGYIWPQHPVGM